MCGQAPESTTSALRNAWSVCSLPATCCRPRPDHVTPPACTATITCHRSPDPLARPSGLTQPVPNLPLRPQIHILSHTAFMASFLQQACLSTYYAPVLCPGAEATHPLCVLCFVVSVSVQAVAFIVRSHFPFPSAVHSSRPPAPALGPISAFFPHLASLSPACDPPAGTCHCWPDVTVIYTSDFSVEQPAGPRGQASSRLPHGTCPGGSGPSGPPSERRGRRITSRWLHVFPCAPVTKRKHHEGRNGVFFIIITSTAAPSGC